MRINSISNQSFGRIYIPDRDKQYINRVIAESSPRNRAAIEYIKNSDECHIWVKNDGDVEYKAGDRFGIASVREKEHHLVFLHHRFKYAVSMITIHNEERMNLPEKEEKPKNPKSSDDDIADGSAFHAAACWNYPGAYNGFSGSGWGCY